MEKLYFKLCIASFFFIAFSGVNINAQPQMMFNKYTIEDGLSNNYIRGIVQDADGLIWLATEDGLNTFNSHSFYVYQNNPEDTTSITNHPIMALEEDAEHNIWVGTWGGGIFIFNKELDNFKQLAHQPNNPNTPRSSFIYDLFKDEQGNMWIGTSGGGINRYDPEQKKFFYYTHNPQNKESLSHDQVSAIAEDRSGNLWIGTRGGGLNRLDPETGIFTRFLHEEDNENSLSSNQVNCVFYDSQQRLWVGTWGYGVNMMTDNTDEFIRYNYHPDDSASLVNEQVWSIAEGENGEIWLGTDNGLSVYNEKKNNFYNYRHNPFDTRSLNGNSIKSLYTDHQGRMWVGTYNTGIGIYDSRLNQFEHFYAKGNQNSLSSNDISAFQEVGDGKHVWVGTDGGGLNLWNLPNNHFVDYPHNPHNPKSIGGNKIKTLLKDNKGGLWIGFWGSGMDYYDPEEKSFTHFGKGKNGINNENITTIAQDHDGYLWLGSFGGGVARFHSDSLSFQYFTQNLSDSGNISSNYIWTILVDKQNNVWVGTINGTLDLFDRKLGKFVPVDYYDKKKTGYSIQTLLEDTPGRLWIGTEGGGLKLLDKEAQTCQSFTTQNGLPSNHINSIVKADDGNLWLGTNYGIASFNPETADVRVFNKHDGLQGLQFNRQASCKLSSGKILLGGVSGFNRFYPDSLKTYDLQVPVVLTNFQIFNKPVPIGAEDSPLQVNINETKTLTLSYDQSVFSIEYVGINYTYPQRTHYQYKLKGFVDESWQKVDKEQKATYTNLHPGNYEFMVTTYDADSKEVNNLAHTLLITITPPWWQTWWARLLALLLLVAVIWIISRWRVRRIKERNKRLEKEVAERTLKLQEANHSLKEMFMLVHEQKEEIQAQAEELAESNEEIKSINHRLEEHVELRTADLHKSNEELDNFVYRVSHDIRAPLSSLLGLVGLMEIEKDSGQLNQYLKMATKSINKLDGFVRDILDYSRNSRMHINRVAINFPELLQSIQEELQYMENATRLEVIKEFNINHPHYSDTRRLHIIFRNLFSNAIKYQNLYLNSPYIKFNISSEKEAAFILIEDNGVGIDAPQIPKVFDMFYRGSELSTGSGIGLYIVKETIEKMGGFITLQSKLGAGTIITIKLPNILPNY